MASTDKTPLGLNLTTTADPPNGVLLSLRKDGDGYIVTDMLGLRYGWAENIGEALEMWADCVQVLLGERHTLGGHLLLEANRYREALRG
jgi:hypothetical protein